MKAEDQTLKQFADVLAAKTPTPGGGGAAAYVAALGTALAGMVGNFTVGKKKYADVEPDIVRIMTRAEVLQNRFITLIDADAEAFYPLSEAYAIPKEDPDRAAKMEPCLVNAMAVPREIMKLCEEAIELQYELMEKGSRLMLSDVGTGATLLRGALNAAATNVCVNAKSLSDRELAAQTIAEVEQELDKYGFMADVIFTKVLEWLES